MDETTTTTTTVNLWQKAFDQWDYQDAMSLLQGRRHKQAVTRRMFYDGDHWQDSAGWIGQVPPRDDKKYGEIMAAITAGFQSENVIGEVVDRHLDACTGREPYWDLLPTEVPSPRNLQRQRLREIMRARAAGTAAPPAPQPAPGPRREGDPPAALSQAELEAADEALVSWWDEHDILDETIEEITRTILLEEKAVVRVRVTGERGEGQTLQEFTDLAGAFEAVNVEVLTADKAGVFTHPITRRKIAVCAYDVDEDSRVELSYLDAGGGTVVRTISKASGEVYLSAPALRLGGRLLVYEVKRKALVTDQICQNNRALNLALTKAMRNVNVAGDLERIFLNTEKPGEWVDEAGNPYVPGQSSGDKKWKDAPYKTGAGVSFFARGVELFDAQGQPTGRADPNVVFREPVDVSTFQGTRDQFYSSILGQARQKFALISGDATASGRSREQARAEFEKSLLRTKTAIDAAGRWLLETVLALAADLCGQGEKYLALRVEFNLLVDAGPLSPEERKENREDVKAGLLAPETHMTRAGVDDPDAETVRIGEAKAKQPPPQPQPAPGNNGGGE